MNPLRRKNKAIKFNNLNDYISFVIKEKYEPLGIVEHWKSWANFNGNIMFIHYEEIHKSEKLDAFLGLENGTCRDFVIQKRMSVRSYEETDEYLSIIKSIDKLERIR
jgi:hypothetical protein